MCIYTRNSNSYNHNRNLSKTLSKTKMNKETLHDKYVGTAMQIIENIIEPLIKKGLNNAAYYEVESDIINIFKQNKLK